jgi:non-canonical purine NTP pyrophosphatase (RdgB/HAM1 family)
LIRWLLESAGPDGISRIAGCFENRRVTARCLVGVTDGSVELFGEGVVEGTVASQPRGEGGFGWDSIFIPDGRDRSYGEMSVVEKNRISHRRLAFESLRTALAKT